MEDSSGIQVLTAQEAADYLRISRTTLYRLAAKGVVPGARVGRTWRFKRSVVDAWLAVVMQDQGGADRRQD